jgi:hypothetical protein
MIKTATLKTGSRISNHVQVQYEAAFAARFKELEHLPNYPALERFAQKCVDLHCGDSLNGISARVYIDKITAMSASELLAWAKTVKE